MENQSQNNAKELEERKQNASEWFQVIRDQICTTFEKLEDEFCARSSSGIKPGRFERTAWIREDEHGQLKPENGGGVKSVMKGALFEKVGVNISTVHGEFSQEFRKTIHGAEEDGQFWASGISLVAHMLSPKVPAIHMNTRFIVTSAKSWFGGGTDLNPMKEVEEDTKYFHQRLKECCDRHDPNYYPKYKKWADDYFMITHRKQARGVGGIFYDYHNSDNWEADFAFTQDVGRTFDQAYADLVRKRMFETWTQEDREHQLRKRGLYTEFNLVYDRGTLFGLKTGGNIEAILMSLPPEAKWD